MKAVLDTSVLVAAFLTEGLCSKILRRARRGEFHLVLSPFILGELKDVLLRVVSAAREEADAALALVSQAAREIVSPKGRVRGACRDPEDDAILDCAAAAEAEVIVTGDRDLLDMRRFEGIRILSPREFEMLFGD